MAKETIITGTDVALFSAGVATPYWIQVINPYLAFLVLLIAVVTAVIKLINAYHQWMVHWKQRKNEQRKD